MEKVITGKTYDIQGFSVQDGPGIRTTVFLKGCPLDCPWCHSPESKEFSSELNWMSIRCIGIDDCGMCIGVCPNDAINRGLINHIELGDDIVYPHVDKSKCNDCGVCANVCKADALYICGVDQSVDEVVNRLIRDKPFFDESNGGVTISGGECLCQPEFTIELLKKCKENQINTAIDTTGFVKWQNIEKALPYSDLFLYDLKCMDSELHKKIIGVPNELILENARKIANKGGRFWIRIPVIPMLNDSKEHFEKYGEFLRDIKYNIDIVQLLPYHKMGISKYDRLLNNQKVFVSEPPNDKLMQARKEQLEGYGLKVRIH
ncbi:glycyl-radical enzyme activating protein [Alkalibaculum sp. M08DMB]|uniref:Glycyl-radical enzyme activating protein n=1 Tax=Alkalibaculum sporogenes TaxID=2655001 RepID=A0A6A7KB19_9FIRM|nr:glycyl-radical enzyme activating protein [Alkalibaculum sporogenes]MPW26739.1 glycyl-radical enzyme activating protein [Alkalibaculum sporogenes]